MANLVTHDERERLAHAAMNLHLNRSLELWLIAFKRRAQSAVQFRVAGFPNFIADMNARDIDIAATEPELDLTR